MLPETILMRSNLGYSADDRRVASVDNASENQLEESVPGRSPGREDGNRGDGQCPELAMPCVRSGVAAAPEPVTGAGSRLERPPAPPPQSPPPMLMLRSDATAF